MSDIDLDMEFDFGFSAVTEDELKAVSDATKTAQYYKDQRDALHKMIVPLLNNLLKNADKPYILWADREAKIKEFRAKIDQLVAD
jgi:hypothetical protein